jgi:hypothetical protein
LTCGGLLYVYLHDPIYDMGSTCGKALPSSHQTSPTQKRNKFIKVTRWDEFKKNFIGEELQT